VPATTSRLALNPAPKAAQQTARQSRKTRLLKLGRQFHLYIGVFSAPALLFFALSGALQTLSLHEAKKGSDYKPPRWIVVMGEIHKKQTIEWLVHKSQSTVTEDVRTQDRHGINEASRDTSHVPTRSAHHPLLLKVFFVIVSLGFFSSVLTGVYMSYKYNRNQRLVTAVLLVGFITPVLLLLA